MRLPTPEQFSARIELHQRMRRDREFLNEMFQRKSRKKALNVQDEDHESGSVEAAEGVEEFFSDACQARRDPAGSNSEAPTDEAGSIGQGDEFGGKSMNDEPNEVDPLAQNAKSLRNFFDEHAAPDADPIFRQVYGDHAITQVGDAVEAVEFDERGRVTSLKLKGSI